MVNGRMSGIPAYSVIPVYPAVPAHPVPSHSYLPCASAEWPV
jgi:hypothetical protein